MLRDGKTGEAMNPHPHAKRRIKVQTEPRRNAVDVL